MPIRYDALFMLIKQRGRTEYWLRQNGISPLYTQQAETRNRRLGRADN